ncbi:MAG: hypothetical protein Alis3KO_36950 [Aliiglaciecola sp.]
MLSSRSKRIMNNEDKGINSGAYRRCLFGIGVNYDEFQLDSDLMVFKKTGVK